MMTENILIDKLNVLIMKETNVLPIPLMILIKVLLVYKNGHIQDSVKINLPASILSNIMLPMKLAEIKNNKQQLEPSNIHDIRVFLTNVFKAG